MRLALALTTAVLAFGSIVHADEIKLRNGRSHRGVQVTGETYEEITYEVGGTPQSEPARDVNEVVYSNQSRSYATALGHMEAGRFAQAAPLFLDAARDRGRKWAGQYGFFYAAECSRLGGNPSGAAAQYKELLQKYPKTRFYPAAKLGLGLTLAAAGDASGARGAFQSLAADAKSKKLGPQWINRAQLEEAKLLERGGDASGATAIYRKLSRLARKDPATGFAAQLGELRLGGDERSASKLQAMIDNEKVPDEVRAGAYVELGKALMSAGEAKPALLAFLRACLDPPLKRFPETRAEALYRAAAAFEQAKTAEWKTRSASLRRELKDTYPSSLWAQK